MAWVRASVDLALNMAWPVSAKEQEDGLHLRYQGEDDVVLTGDEAERIRLWLTEHAELPVVRP